MPSGRQLSELCLLNVNGPRWRSFPLYLRFIFLPSLTRSCRFMNRAIPGYQRLIAAFVTRQMPTFAFLASVYPQLWNALIPLKVSHRCSPCHPLIGVTSLGLACDDLLLGWRSCHVVLSFPLNSGAGPRSIVCTYRPLTTLTFAMRHGQTGCPVCGPRQLQALWIISPLCSHLNPSMIAITNPH